jgi:lysozyme
MNKITRLNKILEIKKQNSIYSRAYRVNRIIKIAVEATPPTAGQAGKVSIPGSERFYTYNYDSAKDVFIVATDNKNNGRYVGQEYPMNTYAYQMLATQGKPDNEVAAAKQKLDQVKSRGQYPNGEQFVDQIEVYQQGGATATQSGSPPVAGAASGGRTSQAGKDFIKKEESGSTRPVLKAYTDYGRFSIGFGNSYYPPRFASKKGYPENRPTKDSGGRTCNGRACVQAQDTISEAEAEEIITEVLLDFEQGVSSIIKQELTQNQFDALVSFAYNMGTGAFGSSNLAKMINENPNDPRIRAEFENYTKADRVDAAAARNLLRRRKKEAAIYFEGRY